MCTRSSGSIAHRVLRLACLAAFALVLPTQAAEMDEDEIAQRLGFDSSAISKDLRLPNPKKNGLCKGVEMQPADSQATGKDLEAFSYENSSPKVSFSLQFPNGKYELGEADKSQLDKLVNVLKRPDFIEARFIVAGHADATGTVEGNLRLSCGRSMEVREYLIAKRISPKRLSAYGFGQNRPIERIEGPSDKNRRVEIIRAD